MKSGNSKLHSPISDNQEPELGVGGRLSFSKKHIFDAVFGVDLVMIVPIGQIKSAKVNFTKAYLIIQDGFLWEIGFMFRLSYTFITMI